LVEILLKVSSNDRIVSVIDDELDITELFRDAICGNIDGISVVTFNDPVLALEHFTENKQDYTFVISDLILRMPSLNGLEPLKRIKNSSPNERTILMSAYNFELDE
jgi:DNA-binding NtrC family response regulator